MDLDLGLHRKLQSILGLDNLAITNIQMSFPANGIATVDLTFIVSKNQADDLVDLMKNYKLVEVD